MHVQQFSSVVLICLSTRERLTSWMHVHCPAILVSGPDLLNHWRGTHILVVCLAIPVSGPNLLNHWRETHILDTCPAILVSSPDLRLTAWMHVQSFSSVVLICSNTREGLTLWMHVQPFLSAVLICLNHWRGTHILDPRCTSSHSCQWSWSAQALKKDSHSGCMFSHSCWWSWSVQTLKRAHTLDACPVISVGDPNVLKNWRTHILDAYRAILVDNPNLLKSWRGTHKLDAMMHVQSFLSVDHGPDLLKHWQGTHILDVFPFYFVSKIHVHHDTFNNIPVDPSKTLIRFR